MARDGKLVGVVSGKGGVGKTTVSVNLGSALALQLKKRVVIVDCNIGTSHLGPSLGMHYCPHTINDVLRGKAELEEALYKHKPTGMTVLPASLKAAGVHAVDAMKIKSVARKLALTHDYVILDGGPGMGREAFATLTAANELLYVTTPTLPSVLDVVRYTEALQGEDKTHLGVVLNMFEKASHLLTMEDVERLTQLKVITTIPTDVEVQKSLAAELPVVVFSPNSRSSRAFTELAAKVAGVYTPPPANPTIRQLVAEQVRRLDELIGF